VDICGKKRSSGSAMNGSTSIFTRINEPEAHYGSTCAVRKSVGNAMAAMKDVVKYPTECGSVD